MKTAIQGKGKIMDRKIIIRNGFSSVRQAFLLARTSRALVLFVVSFFVFETSASLVSVSVTGTANTNAMGYTQGESYTFNWIVNDGYTGSDGFGDGGDVFSSTENQWFSTSTNDPWLWSSVSGDGLVGTYMKANANDQAPFEQLKVDSAGLLCWAASHTDSITIGLFVNGVAIDTIVAYDLNIPDFNYSDTSFINPATYLGSYTGTYTSSGGGSILVMRI